MSLNLQSLLYFDSVAKIQNYTKAADNLYISQSTLSKSIQSLENELGVPLFEKSGRGVRLTRFGHALYNSISGTLDSLQSSLEQFQITANSYRGVIDLGLPLVIRHPFPTNVVTSFLRRYPDTEVHCKAALMADLFDLVRDGTLDLAIVFSSKAETSEDIHQEFLYMDEICLAVPECHPLASKKSVCFDDFKDEEFIGFPPASYSISATALVQKQLSKQQIEWTPRCRLIANDTISFVRSGAGLSFLPCTTVHPEGVVYLPIEGFSAFQRYSIIWNSKRQLSPLSTALKASLLQAACELPSRCNFFKEIK